MHSPRYLPFGDAALVVEFGDGVDPQVGAMVVALDARVSRARIEGLVETAPTFRSLLVQFDPLVTDGPAVEARIDGLLAGLEPASQQGRLWRLPACYEGECGPDIADVAARAGLAADEVVTLHAGAEHRVYMLGFLPGCPYMGGLPGALHLPRRTDPRLAVPQGSLAIAVGLTLVYPVESPGGWHLIGRTPAPLFSTEADPPALLAPGDRVRFDPVSRREHDLIAAAAAAGEWRPEAEALLS